jgi:hypothetical protein
LFCFTLFGLCPILKHLSIEHHPHSQSTSSDNNNTAATLPAICHYNNIVTCVEIPDVEPPLLPAPTAADVVHTCVTTNNNTVLLKHFKPPRRPTQNPTPTCNTIYKPHFPTTYKFPLPICQDDALGALPLDKYNALTHAKYSRLCVQTTRAAAKLTEIFEVYPPRITRAMDIGCGPGACGEVLKHHAKQVYGTTYGIPVDAKYQGFYTDYATQDINVTKPSPNIRPDLIFCDIGDRSIHYNTYQSVIDYATTTTPHSTLIIKSFTPAHNESFERINSIVRLLMSNYRTVDIIKPSSSGEFNHEIYFHCATLTQHNPTQSAVDKIYDDMWLIESKRRTAVTLALLNPLPCRYAPPADITTSQYTLTINDVEIQSMRNSLKRTDLNPQINKALRLASTLRVEPTTSFTSITGVPGCGKTKYLKKHNNRDTILITPTNKLMITAKDDFNKVRVYTPHTAFTAKKCKTLVIDEIVCYPIGYISFISRHLEPKRIVVAGDVFQIAYCDFDAPTFHNNRVFSDFFDNINFNSRRCPQDVTAILAQGKYPMMTSSSPVNSSISLISAGLDVAHRISETFSAPIITYNQQTAALTIDPNTVHQYQGQTVRNVILYIDTHAIDTNMLRSVCHTHVALTRHTDNLLVVGETNAFARSLFIHGSNNATNLETHDHTPTDSHKHREVAPVNSLH